MDLDRPARAEQEGIHGDGEVGQHLEQARRLESLMQRRALGRQAPVVVPLAQRPQHETLADRQPAGAARAAAALTRSTIDTLKPLFC